MRESILFITSVQLFSLRPISGRTEMASSFGGASMAPRAVHQRCQRTRRVVIKKQTSLTNHPHHPPTLVFPMIPRYSHIEYQRWLSVDLCNVDWDNIPRYSYTGTDRRVCVERHLGRGHSGRSGTRRSQWKYHNLQCTNKLYLPLHCRSAVQIDDSVRDPCESRKLSI